MILTKFPKSRIIKIELPAFIRRGQQYFFPAQLDLLSREIISIRCLYEPDSDTEQPSANIKGILDKNEINNFVVSFSDNIDSSDKDTFCYYKMPATSFADGNEANKVRFTSKKLSQRINFSRSFIQVVKPFALRNSFFYLQIFYI